MDESPLPVPRTGAGDAPKDPGIASNCHQSYTEKDYEGKKKMKLISLFPRQRVISIVEMTNIKTHRSRRSIIDQNKSHVYRLALPLVGRSIPI